MVSDESLVAPLRCYLESDVVRAWLDHKVPRKGQRWMIQEQDLRILPVPHRLLDQLGQNPGEKESGFALPFPGRWEKLASDLRVAPQNVRQALLSLDQDEVGAQIRCALFVRASRILQELGAQQTELQGWVRPDASIIWRELVRTFPPSDFSPVTVNSQVNVRGQMPLLTPITHQSIIKVPQSLLLATEAGHQVILEISNRFVLDIVWDQIQALDKPTWTEIIEFVRVPRRPELLEMRAADLLRVQGEQQSMQQHLATIISETLPALLKSSDAY